MKKKNLLILLIGLMTLPIMNVNAVNCGNVTGIPAKIPQLTSLVITIIEIAVPIILVITGSIDLLKGVAAQKEDEIKKGQQLLIKRLITGVIIFFFVMIVKFIISAVADTNDTNNITSCMDCFLSNKCEAGSANSSLEGSLKKETK